MVLFYRWLRVRLSIVASILWAKGNRDSLALLPGGARGTDFTRGKNDGMFTIIMVNCSLYSILVIYDYWIFSGDDAPQYYRK